MALVVFALMVAAVLRDRILLHAPITTDENSYLLQAYTFLSGRLKLPVPPMPDLFQRQMTIIDERAGWVSRYPPGHALWLATGCLFDRPYWAVLVGLACSLFLLASAAQRLGYGRLAPLALAAASPFLLFTHATMLSHTTGFLSVCLCIYGHTLWRCRHSHAGAVLAGIGWGWLWLNRTFVAMPFAAGLGLESLFHLWHHRHERQAWWQTLSFAGTCALAVLAYMGYNWLIIGDPLLPTYLYCDPTEGPGFGIRHSLSGGPIHHTPAAGCRALLANLGLYDRWLWGFPGGLMLAALLSLPVIRSAFALTAWGLTLLAWLAGIAFWSRGPSETGPGYMFETLPLVLLVAAGGLSRLWRRPAPGWRLAVACLFLAAACGFVRVYFRDGRQLRDAQGPLETATNRIRALPPDSVVFCAGILACSNHDIILNNPRGLDSRPLILRSFSPHIDQAAARLLSDRRPYFFNTGVDADPEPLTMAELPPFADGRSARCSRLDTGTRIYDSETDEWWVAFDAANDPAGDILPGHDFPVPPGRFEFMVDMETGAAATEMPPAVQVRLLAGTQELASVVNTQALARKSIRIPLAVPKLTLVTASVSVTGQTGWARWYAVEVEERPR